uniref:serine/arginine repetitive matrix protein 2-like n=1 Tax=Panthera onca TaxID=9690 RepID=UPI002953C46E|nr:serine/arginine repetitive matrix protein 2-like [Panthera onca]
MSSELRLVGNRKDKLSMEGGQALCETGERFCRARLKRRCRGCQRGGEAGAGAPSRGRGCGPLRAEVGARVGACGDTCKAVGVRAKVRGCREELGARWGEGCAQTSKRVVESGTQKKFKRLIRGLHPCAKHPRHLPLRACRATSPWWLQLRRVTGAPRSGCGAQEGAGGGGNLPPSSLQPRAHPRAPLSGLHRTAPGPPRPRPRTALYGPQVPPPAFVREAPGRGLIPWEPRRRAPGRRRRRRRSGRRRRRRRKRRRRRPAAEEEESGAEAEEEEEEEAEEEAEGSRQQRLRPELGRPPPPPRERRAPRPGSHASHVRPLGAAAPRRRPRRVMRTHVKLPYEY